MSKELRVNKDPSKRVTVDPEFEKVNIYFKIGLVYRALRESGQEDVASSVGLAIGDTATTHEDVMEILNSYIK